MGGHGRDLFMRAPGLGGAYQDAAEVCQHGAAQGGTQHGVDLCGFCQPGIAQQVAFLQSQLRPAGRHRLELDLSERVLLLPLAPGPRLVDGVTDGARGQLPFFKIPLPYQCKAICRRREEEGLHGVLGKESCRGFRRRPVAPLALLGGRHPVRCNGRGTRFLKQS